MNRRVLALGIAVVLALGALQLTGCTKLKNAAASRGPKTDVKLEVLVKGAMLGLDTQLNKGDIVRVKESGNTVGQIESVTTTATLQSVPNADGGLVASPVPNQQDIHIIVAGSAVQAEDGFRFDGERVWVNQDVNMITPFVQFKGTVLAIRETGK